MNGKTYAYLDLAALPAVGAALLNPAPAWIFRGDGTGLLWANAEGAAFLGAGSMGELLTTRFGSANPLVKQVSRLARVLPSETSRLEILRFTSGFSLTALPVACRRLNLADGAAVLAVGISPATTDSLTTRAERLADLIAGEDCLVAVIEGDGRILAASGGFQHLAPASAEIDRLVEDVASEETGILKRPIHLGDRSRPAGIARFAAGEETLALLIVGPEDASKPAAQPEAAVAPVTAAISEAGSNAPSIATSKPSAAVTRFLWRSDAENRLTFISDELKDATGTEPAALLGRRWPEIASDLFPDEEAKISEAFAGRGQWNGLKVYWPASTEGLRIGTELSAFPMAERGAFAGYRGFGLVRRDDTIATPPADPTDDAETATASASGNPEASGQSTSETESPANAGTAEAPPPAGSSNVVHLPPRPPVTRLSAPEEDAFRRIAEALGVPLATDRERVPHPVTDNPSQDNAPAAPPAAAPEAMPDFAMKVLDRLPVSIAVFRGETTLFANRPLLDLLGYETQQEFGAAGGNAAIFPDQDTGWTGTETAGADRQLAARRKDGSRIAVEARLQAVPWGGMTALMLSLRELPPRRERESEQDRLIEEIAAIETRVDELQAILDTATDGVVVVDSGGRILNLNRSAEALFGIDANEVLGSPFTGLLAEESRKAALDYLDGLAANGVASVLNDGREVIGRVPQGGLIPLFMTMGRLGETGKFCAVLRDITQWKNAEEELVAARRAAEAANAQKSDFLAKISHEIRTPLNAIIGFSEVMMEERFGSIGNPRYRDYLRDIHVSGSHLMSLINDLLDLSKIEAGKMELAFESVAVNETIQECVALMQPQANRARIIIRTSLSSGVPNIVADARSLRQILLNLLSNAVKFTKAGGQVIVSSATEDSGEVVIRIRDTGVGMSARDIETALKPFRQLSTSGGMRGEGTGLGLPLTKALVEANRAAFAIDSAVDQGTLVKITFPTTRVLAG